MINSNFGFTPLKEVWLGDCYPASFYDHYPSDIRDAFQLITEWTKEDTNRLQLFLESRGITVRRPTFYNIEYYLDQKDNLVKPPITPRDDYFVLGQTLYSLHRVNNIEPWQHWLDHYANQGFDVQSPQHQPINCISPPSVVRVGRDLFVDTETHQHVWGFACEWAVNQSKHYRINFCDTQGHSDSVFCPVNRDIIVTSKYKFDYSQSFPGWQIFRIPEKLKNFRGWQQWQVTKSVDNNVNFANHITSKASDWVGNFQETVPEVNMLVIDEHNVVAMKEYPPLCQWLKERGVTVHVFDLRTRSFWDGGWHCLTLDIHRQDTQDDLFPERGDNGVYWRLQ